MRFEIPKKLSSIQFGILSPDDIKSMAVVRIDRPILYNEEGRGFPGGPLDPKLGAADNTEKCDFCSLRRREGETGCMGHFGYIDLASPVYHPGFIKHIEKVLNAICEKCGRLTLPPNRREYYWNKMKKFIERYGYPSFDIAKQVLNEAAKVTECPYCGVKKEGKFVYSKTEMTFVKRIELTKEEAQSIKEEERKFIISGSEITSVGRRQRIVSKGGKFYINIYFSPKQIQDILSQIYEPEFSLDKEEKEEREKDIYLLGFHPELARPEWTILTILPVPPINVRPPVRTAEGLRSEDHLTITIRDIVRVNEQLKSKMRGGPPQVISQLWQKLQKLVKALYGLHRIGEIKVENVFVRGIIHRLSGKEGRFRHNLSGKRVDFSGRAVISPDPYLSIDEIGIPEKVAKTLWVPEVVNELNLERLKQLVINGPDIYPGASYILRKIGPGTYNKILLEVFKSREEREAKAQELKPGDIVERHLLDGDILVFNRQPTLHRISMMGHYVRVLPYNTFRLHLMTCPPYNADFDGDEMNIHLPRSYETRAEVSTIMEVKRHIITSRYGGPIIGPKQDYITGAYLLTKDGTLLEKDEVIQVLFYAGIDRLPKPTTKIGDKEYWDGKVIFSQIIPKYVFYEGEIKGILCGKSTEEKCKVKIWNGEVLKGVVDKNAIGAEKPKNLVHKIIERYGYEAGKRFLNNMAAMINRYLTDHGFSLTLWDVRIPKEAKREIKEALKNYIEEANKLVQDYLENKLQAEPGLTRKETFENRIVDILDKARSEAGKVIMRHLPMESQFIIMTVTGARGDETNIQQVIACIGQPVVRGKRLSRGYDQRTLPHFKKGDIGPFAGGFVVNSFATGMNPIEYFFHNAGGRDSLVDTAVRTADSGYFYRRLVNALQDSRIEYDGTARMMGGYIVQFKYGGDGIHPGKSYHGKLADYESIFYELIVRREERNVKPKVRKRWPSYYDEALKTLKEEISLAVSEDVKEVFEKMLKRGLVLTEDETKEFVNRVLEKYLRALVDPGEAIGTVAAQSISEPATQLTLRTFHWAGVAAFSITTGLPRLKEIFDAVEKPSTPMISVYLDKEHCSSERKTREVLNRIKAVTIYDVIKRGGLVFQPEFNRIRISLSRDDLRRLNLTPEYIAEELGKIGKVRVEHEEKYVINVYPASDEITLPDVFKKVREKVFKGIKGYEKAQPRKSEYGEYYILIPSAEIIPLLYVEGIDISRLETNSIHAFARVFGIEAARRLIVKEAKKVLDQYGLDVDMRHLLYVADIMTMHGEIEAIGRYGIVGRKASVLARAAFEETGKHIFRAAATGMVDPLLGATENVIVGGIPPVGTGYVRIGYVKTPIKRQSGKESE